MTVRATILCLTALAASTPARGASLVRLGTPPATLCDGPAPPRAHLAADGQCYEPSLAGIEALCTARPTLCAAPQQRAELERLRGHRRAGFILMGAGVVAAAAGVAIFVRYGLDGSSGAQGLLLFPPILGAGIAAGIVLPIAGWSLMPSRGDAERFVNQVNATQLSLPNQVELSRQGPRAARVVRISYTF